MGSRKSRVRDAGGILVEFSFFVTPIPVSKVTPHD